MHAVEGSLSTAATIDGNTDFKQHVSVPLEHFLEGLVAFALVAGHVAAHPVGADILAVCA